MAFPCFTYCMSVAKKRKDVDAPATEDETPRAIMPPALPPGMIGVEDLAAREHLIALDQLSREDKQELWQRLRRDLPELADQMSTITQAFGGRAVTLNLNGFDAALHADYKARERHTTNAPTQND